MRPYPWFRARASSCLLAAILLSACGRPAAVPPETEPAPPTPAAESAAPDPEALQFSDVTLGPGDEIDVSVWRNPDLGGKYSVDPTGKIALPLVGLVDVQGVGLLDLRDRITTSLETYLKEPQVTIRVTAPRSRKFYVLGEVNKPGIFYLGNEVIPLVEALALAGGLTEDAQDKKIYRIAGAGEGTGGKPEIVDMTRLFKQGDLKQNAQMRGGDIIYVAPTGLASTARFFVHLEQILKPILTFERVVIFAPVAVDAAQGELNYRNVSVQP